MRRAAGRREFARAVRHIRGTKRAAQPGFVEPLLATSRDAAPPGADWIHEIKHDGYRAQAHLSNGKCTIYTRRGYDWSARFSTIASAVSELPASTAILDGEVVVVDERGISDFGKLQEALAQNRTDRLIYFIFDLLYLDGVDLRGASLIDRKECLAALFQSIPRSGRIRLSEHIEAEASDLVQRACTMQLEGIVSKERKSPYRSGRQETWIKVKCNKTDTFPIIAFVEKLGANPRRIASLYLGRWENGRLLYAGKAQTGFRHQALYELRERLDPYVRATSPLSVPVKKPKATWVDPVLQAEIEYSALTSDKLLRAPVYRGMRDDLLISPPRTPTAMRSSPRVPKENILQLLPDAVAPSKEQLAEYWRKVASRALKYLAGRPLKLVRHTRDTTFYHMGPLPPVPVNVHQMRVQKRQGGEGTRLWVDDLAGLLGLVEMGAVELHPWNSRIDDVEHPDVLVFDLDPGSGIEWDFVVETALGLRDVLKAERLDSWPKLTGGKGLHIMAPIESNGMTHDEAHKYSRTLAHKFAARDHSRYTTSALMTQRAGRLFIDYLRNGRGTTAVGTFSPRARPGFPIAAPVTWAEVKSGIRPDAFTMDFPLARASIARVPTKRKSRSQVEPSRFEPRAGPKKRPMQPSKRRRQQAL